MCDEQVGLAAKVQTFLEDWRSLFPMSLSLFCLLPSRGGRVRILAALGASDLVAFGCCFADFSLQSERRGGGGGVRNYHRSRSSNR